MFHSHGAVLVDGAACLSAQEVVVMNGRIAGCTIFLALGVLSTVALPNIPDFGIAGRLVLHPPNGNGIYPRGIAYDGSQLFIANWRSDTLSIAETSGDVIWSVDVGSFPTDVAVDEYHQKAFVTNAGDDTVTVVDAADWNVLGTIPVGREPVAVAVNQTTHRVYVANQGPPGNEDNTVTIIDASSQAVIDTVTVDGRPGGIAVDEVTNEIFVMLWLDSRVAIIDGDTNAVGHFQGFSIYHGDIAVNPATDRLYLLDYVSDKVAVFVESTRTYTSQFYIGPSPSAMDIDTEDNRLYVVYAYGLVVADCATNTVAGYVDIGSHVNAQDVAVAPDQNMFYVACTNATLRQYRTSDLGLVQVEPIGVFPRAVAVNGVTKKVYAVCSSVEDEPGDVFALAEEPAGFKLRIPVESEPTAVAVNPVTNKVYVTHEGSPGRFTIINGATDQVVTVHDLWCMDVAVNPTTNLIYGLADERYTPVDGTTDALLPYVDIPWGNNRHIAVDPGLNRIYTSSTYSGGRVGVFDGATNNEITRISEGGKDIAVDPVHHVVYVGDWNDRITVIDGMTNAIVTTIPMPIGVGPIAVDPVSRMVFVGDPDSNDVYAINGVSNTIVGTVEVDSGVWGIAVDEVTPRVFTANLNAGTVVILGAPTIFNDDFESGDTTAWSNTVP